MPFYNAEAYIREALLAVQEQDFSDWELLLVDDASTDAGRAVVEEFVLEDSRFRLFINPEKGIIPALQLGLDAARGKYIGRFDADDRLPPDRLRLMSSFLDGSKSKTIITGLAQYFSDRPISNGYAKYQNWLNETNLNGETWEEIYRECPIGSPNWLMNREELIEVGGFKGLSYPEDYDWCFRCYQHQFEVHCLSATTLFWREHPLRTSRNSEHYQQQAFFELKIRRFTELEAFEELIIWGTGRKARLAASLLDDLGIKYRWMDLEPGRYPNGINGQEIEDYRGLSVQQGQKILVGVYPNPSERRDLEAFLVSRLFIKGRDFWYL